MKDLKQRLISAIVGIVILLFVLYKGGVILNAVIFILSLEALRELYVAFGKKDISLNHVSLLIGTVLLFCLEDRVRFEFSLIAVLIISFAAVLFTEKYSIEDTTYTVFSFVYTSYMLNLMSVLENKYLYLVFVIAFSTDTFAYFTGNFFGKHKLIPKVSPNKSVEGAIGGIIGCFILSLIYMNSMNIVIETFSVIFIIIASIAGQIGDLMASKIKRITGIKDYAKIIPGHGGVLDRFDSIIMVIPFVYILQFILN